ncbi:MAG: universal stress protein [Bacteroidota bacterium]
MKPINILIPTDFSKVSEQAFLMTELLSRKIPVKVYLLHVIEANSSVISENLNDVSDKLTIEKKEQEALKQFDALYKAGRIFDPLLKTGLLIEQIHFASLDIGVDLVIMGTNGASGFMEKVSGSEAQHVVRHLDVPVITLRSATSITDLENILLVADFEYFGKGIQIDLIRQIAEAFGSTIHLLQILKEEDEAYADQIEAQMKFFAEEHQLKYFKIHLYRDHKVTDGVKNFNRESEMDLVCIRTNGRKGLSHLLFGSIAERLVNHCQKPLFTFKLRESLHA